MGTHRERESGRKERRQRRERGEYVSLSHHHKEQYALVETDTKVWLGQGEPVLLQNTSSEYGMHYGSIFLFFHVFRFLFLLRCSGKFVTHLDFDDNDALSS